MFIFRLEYDNGQGPFSSRMRDYDCDIREMLIKHLVPEEQGLDHMELCRVKDELIYAKEYHFAWSTPELMAKYVQFNYIHQVQHTGCKVVVYSVPNQHTYILPKDGQVIFDRKHQTKVATFEYHDFCLNVDWKQWK